VYWKQHNLEIIYYRERGDEFIEIQVAVDGMLALPMDIHKSVRDVYSDEDSWLNYLTQSGETMLGLYGDARIPIRVEQEVIEQFACA